MICGLNLAISLLPPALIHKLISKDAIERRLLKNSYFTMNILSCKMRSNKSDEAWKN